MTRLLQPLLLLLANATDKELARHVQYLKAENRILRDKLPKRLTVTAAERQRLLKYGKPLGAAIRHLITIVSPRTFTRWLNGELPQGKKKTRNPGRPKTNDELRDLVLRLARENGWGYTRILGELKKLGMGKICRTTVQGILREHGLDPGPKRGEGTWDEFLKRHTSTLWACDFFSKKIWTQAGLVEYFVLFFIQVGSRRVHIAGMTAHPDSQWMAQQARNVAMFFAEQPEKPRYLLRDHDTKFTKTFDAILESEGAHVIRVGPRAPNQNAHAERFVQSVKAECLDHFVVFGEKHLRHLIHEYKTYYLSERPHQGLENRLVNPGPDSVPSQGEVVCQKRLGGLLKHYYRKAG